MTYNASKELKRNRIGNPPGQAVSQTLPKSVFRLAHSANSPRIRRNGRRPRLARLFIMPQGRFYFAIICQNSGKRNRILNGLAGALA
jgi:hypothetical protein